MNSRVYSLALLMFLVCTAPVFAERPENDLYGQIQYFTWKEFVGGSRRVKESGPLYAIGYSGKFFIKERFTIKPRAEIFGGRVNYDGHACNISTLECFPSESDTNYFGFKTDADFGIKFTATEKLILEPFAGLGFRWWNREIQDTADARGGTESWGIFYGRLGLRGGLGFTENLKGFAEAAMKIPIANHETAEDVCNPLGQCNDYDLEPGRELSYYAELGMKYKTFKAAFFYEGLRFSESDHVYIGGSRSIFQPESQADIFGLNAGISF